MSRKGPVTPPRKRSFESLSRWQVGEELECAWTSGHYADTIHPVRVVKVLKGNRYSCKMLAFDDDEPLDEVEEHDLMEYRGPEPNHSYKVGDRVQFKYFQRRIDNKLVDGYAGNEEGVWVKGTITKMKPGELKIKHTDWSYEGNHMLSWIVRRHVRRDL